MGRKGKPVAASSARALQVCGTTSNFGGLSAADIFAQFADTPLEDPGSALDEEVAGADAGAGDAAAEVDGTPEGQEEAVAAEAEAPEEAEVEESPEPVGGTVGIRRFHASSNAHAAECARRHEYDSAYAGWSPATDGPGEYLEVQFHAAATVVGVSLEPRRPCTGHWAQTHQLLKLALASPTASKDYAFLSMADKSFARPHVRLVHEVAIALAHDRECFGRGDGAWRVPPEFLNWRTMTRDHQLAFFEELIRRTEQAYGEDSWEPWHTTVISFLTAADILESRRCEETNRLLQMMCYFCLGLPSADGTPAAGGGLIDPHPQIVWQWKLQYLSAPSNAWRWYAPPPGAGAEEEEEENLGAATEEEAVLLQGSDGVVPRHVDLARPIVASRVRIHPVWWTRHAGLRCDVKFGEPPVFASSTPSQAVGSKTAAPAAKAPAPSRPADARPVALEPAKAPAGRAAAREEAAPEAFLSHCYSDPIEDGLHIPFPEELLVVDAARDPELRAFLSDAEAQLSSWSTASSKILAATRLVTAACGDEEGQEERWHELLASARILPHVNLMIGRLMRSQSQPGAGLSRHRAVLLKLALERLGVCRAALVPRPADCAARFAWHDFWVVVWVADQPQPFVVSDDGALADCAEVMGRTFFRDRPCLLGSGTSLGAPNEALRTKAAELLSAVAPARAAAARRLRARAWVPAERAALPPGDPARECMSRLEDLIQEIEGHDESSDAHEVGAAPAASSADVAYAALSATIGPELVSRAWSVEDALADFLAWEADSDSEPEDGGSGGEEDEGAAARGGQPLPEACGRACIAALAAWELLLAALESPQEAPPRPTPGAAAPDAAAEGQALQPPELLASALQLTADQIQGTKAIQSWADAAGKAPGAQPTAVPLRPLLRLVCHALNCPKLIGDAEIPDLIAKALAPVLAGPSESQPAPTWGQVEAVAARGQEEALFTLAARVLLLMLRAMPAAVRAFWEGLRKRDQNLVELLVSRSFSPLLVQEEAAAAQALLEAQRDRLPDVEAIVVRRTNKLVLKLCREELKVELSVHLPEAFPLRIARAELPEKMPGIPQPRVRSWMLQARQVLAGRKPRGVGRAMLTWVRNFALFFEGFEDCPICYRVVHISTQTMPRKACPTCKHKFHSECLYHWFKSSSKTTCPLCSQPF